MDNKHVFSEGLFNARTGLSFILAIIAEVLLALTVAGIIIWHELHPAPPPPVQKVAVITIPKNPPPPPPPPPKTPLPKMPTPQPLSEVPAIPVPVPVPNAIPPQPPQPPIIPRPQPKVNMNAIRSEFNSRVKAAIDAAKVYPREAILSGATGIVRVTFYYKDQHVSDVQIERSSGNRALDRAAMEAVNKAQYPVPPPQLAGQRIRMVINVQFTLGD